MKAKCGSWLACDDGGQETLRLAAPPASKASQVAQRRYGEWKSLNAANPNLDQTFSPQWVTDLVDVDAVGIHRHRCVVQWLPDQAQRVVGRLLGLELCAAQGLGFRAVGAQGALLPRRRAGRLAERPAVQHR